MRKTIGLLVLEATSTAALVLGVAALLLPVILYVWLAADNDAYVTLAEATSMQPVILLEFGLEPIYRLSFLLWPAAFLMIGIVLRWLMLRWHGTPALQTAKEA